MMALPPPKLCPECGEEYLHTASVCAHCDVALVHPEEASAQPSQELPPVSELELIRVASAGWALALSEHLVEAGVPHRLEAVSEDAARAGRRGAGPGPYGVYVRPQDAAAARAIDTRHIAREIPDLPDDFDPAADPSGDGCPACGAALEPEASECPDCGLALVESE